MPQLLVSPFVGSPCLAGILTGDFIARGASQRPPLRGARPRTGPSQGPRLPLEPAAAVTVALLYLQPLAWRLSRRLEAVAEEVCDDYVVQLGEDRQKYAETLLNLAERNLWPASEAAIGLRHARGAALRSLSSAKKLFVGVRKVSGRSGRRGGSADRVLVLAFSEFGRRAAENASEGTDHEAAVPIFLAGPKVAAGLHGPTPNLAELVDGDVKMAIDFRQVYATVLDSWLQLPQSSVLAERFEPLPLIAT